MTKEEILKYLKSTELFDDAALGRAEKLIDMSNKTIKVGDLVERFVEVDWFFEGTTFNLKQILNNILMVVDVEKA